MFKKKRLNKLVEEYKDAQKDMVIYTAAYFDMTINWVERNQELLPLYEKMLELVTKRNEELKEEIVELKNKPANEDIERQIALYTGDVARFERHIDKLKTSTNPGGIPYIHKSNREWTGLKANGLFALSVTINDLNTAKAGILKLYPNFDFSTIDMTSDMICDVYNAKLKEDFEAHLSETKKRLTRRVGEAYLSENNELIILDTFIKYRVPNTDEINKLAGNIFFTERNPKVIKMADDQLTYLLSATKGVKAPFPYAEMDKNNEFIIKGYTKGLTEKEIEDYISYP